MKVDRLVSIIFLLLEKKRVNAQELAEMFEVSPRTIYRDIDAICMAGIPICATSGVGGGFEIMPGYKIEKNVFGTSDLAALLMGLSSLTGVMRGNELIHTLAKVKSFIPADQAKEIEGRVNQIYIDLHPWMGTRDMQPYLEIIQKALEENKLLSLLYLNHKGAQTHRIVEPYQLVSKYSHWYVQCYCRMREDFRLFKLARILSLELQEEGFSPREYPKPQLSVEDMDSSSRKTVILRIHCSLVERLLDYCPFEHFKREGDSHYIVQLPFVENDYYYDMLLGFGDRCECLSPPKVRSEMRRRIQALASIYESSS